MVLTVTMETDCGRDTGFILVIIKNKWQTGNEKWDWNKEDCDQSKEECVCLKTQIHEDLEIRFVQGNKSVYDEELW